MYRLVVFFVCGFLTLGTGTCYFVSNETTSKGTQKIVGGVYAKPGEFPYHIIMRKNGHYVCGGALISDRHVITAAHCVHNTHPMSLTITTGTVSLYGGGSSYQVQSILSHPHFRQDEVILNDIAVLTLSRPVALSQFVGIVSLPTSRHNIGEIVTVTGFGSHAAGQGPSSNLKKLRVPLMDPATCSRVFPGKISTGHVCSFVQNGIGTCQGDSGSPLVDDGGELVGVVSWGIPCALGYPDMYSNVFYYKDFVHSCMR